MNELEQKKATVVAGANPLAKTKKTLKAASLGDPEAIWFKILGYGDSGVGKTLAIIGFLLAGLKVFVLSTDIGGNGLSSIRTALKDMGREDLMSNLVFVEVADYKTTQEFLVNPDIVMVEVADEKGLREVSLNEWNPDMLVWEGFSNWQENHLCSYVLGMDAISSKASEMRQEGLLPELQDYNAIRRGTLSTLDRFLNLRAKNGKVWHKYVTCLEDNKAKEDPLSGNKAKKMPLLVGSARTYMGPAFDLILEMQAKSSGGKTEFVYKCDVGGSSVSKKRGLNVDTTEPADMLKLWTKINQQVGK
jgi:hypothetical protein